MELPADLPEPPPRRRRSGTTVRQMLAAPKGALFVWCTWNDDAARILAAKHGRLDLVIVGSDVLNHEEEWQKLRWREFPAVVLDHQLRDSGLDDDQMRGYRFMLTRIRTPLP